jgi:NAD-dependent deacetylase
MHHPIDEPTVPSALDRAAEHLGRAGRVAVLTGAGVSAESGVATFRGAGGLWEGHPVEEVATPEAFTRDPRLVWRFYNLRRANLASVKPNPGHEALARLEQRWGSDRFAIVTQNIDRLHQAAGSRHVLELHGSLTRVRCSGCQQIEDRGYEPLPELPACSACGALLRPDVVWFGEMLPSDIWQKATEVTATCQCFLVVGTSAVVFPAAGLIELARTVGATVIEVNLEQTPASPRADVCLYGPSGELLPALLGRLGADTSSARDDSQGSRGGERGGDA